MRRIGRVVTAIASTVMVAANVASSAIHRFAPGMDPGPSASDLYLVAPPQDQTDLIRQLIGAQVAQPAAFAIAGSNTRLSSFTADAVLRARPGATFTLDAEIVERLRSR